MPLKATEACYPPVIHSRGKSGVAAAGITRTTDCDSVSCFLLLLNNRARVTDIVFMSAFVLPVQLFLIHIQFYTKKVTSVVAAAATVAKVVVAPANYSTEQWSPRIDRPSG